MMLDFVYNFIDFYFSRDDYELGHTDTDSLYLAFSKTESGHFEDLVKPHLLENYFENRGKNLPTEVCAIPDCCQLYVSCRVNYFPWVQPRCADAALFDKRTQVFLRRSMREKRFAF